MSLYLLCYRFFSHVFCVVAKQNNKCLNNSLYIILSFLSSKYLVFFELKQLRWCMSCPVSSTKGRKFSTWDVYYLWIFMCPSLNFWTLQGSSLIQSFLVWWKRKGPKLSDLTLSSYWGSFACIFSVHVSCWMLKEQTIPLIRRLVLFLCIILFDTKETVWMT